MLIISQQLEFTIPVSFVCSTSLRLCCVKWPFSYCQKREYEDGDEWGKIKRSRLLLAWLLTLVQQWRKQKGSNKNRRWGREVGRGRKKSKRKHKQASGDGEEIWEDRTGQTTEKKIKMKQSWAEVPHCESSGCLKMSIQTECVSAHHILVSFRNQMTIRKGETCHETEDPAILSGILHTSILAVKYAHILRTLWEI